MDSQRKKKAFVVQKKMDSEASTCQKASQLVRIIELQREIRDSEHFVQNYEHLIWNMGILRNMRMLTL